MAQYRSLKKDFFTSASITVLSPWARLFYQATWLEADREGRLKRDYQTLKNRYFPADAIDLMELGDELKAEGLIKLYEVDGKQYAWIPTFADHQVINNREKASVLPAPVGKEGKVKLGKVSKEGA
ncbi:MAG: hypothetical protein IID17_14890 [Nitrospinae bacterium]|nr:hypothetical protein [Nitrospinota bacterium]